jgi:hypothetical protein
MSIERWDLSPSAQPDRYILKVRGDRAALDRLVQTYARVCQEPREIADPVYQWAVYVVGATLNERLAIQDELRELAAPHRPSAPPADTVDLSGVLSELTMVLESLTDLTEEEQARVAKKLEEIHQRDAEAPPIPAPPPSFPARPTAAPENLFSRDVPKTSAAEAPPIPAQPPPAAPPPSNPGFSGIELGLGPMDPGPAPAAPVRESAPARPAEPPPAPPAPKAPAPPPSAPPAPAVTKSGGSEAGGTPAKTGEAVPPDQRIRVACFHAAGRETVKEKFLGQLTEVAQKKARKPLFVEPALSRATPLSVQEAPRWIEGAKSASADAVFILLTRDLLPDFLDKAAVELRQAGFHCFLIPEVEVDSRLLYVDLMVELLLVKRKR